MAWSSIHSKKQVNRKSSGVEVGGEGEGGIWQNLKKGVRGVGNVEGLH